MAEHGMTEQEFQKLLIKENNLMLFKKDGKEIFILGTIHHFHLIEASNYSLAQAASVIKTIKPDILLIEARQETLEKHNAVDGPIEMIFARSYAAEQNLLVKGIDWWKVIKDNAAKERMDAQRDDRILDNILSAAENHNRALALMGASHRERMPERFLKKGYVKVEIDDIPGYFNNADIPFRYPEGMKEEACRSNKYYQTVFLQELNQNLNPDDELYEMFFELTRPSESWRKMHDMINEHRLFKS